jgi:hypothetical protein
MTIENSTLKDHVTATSDLDLGRFYFLNNFVITEFKEGVHLTYENTKELFKLAKKHFGSNLFGYVSNRVNNYSVSPTDYPLFDNELSNISVFGVVCYNQNNKSNIDIENRFSKNNIQVFDNLYYAAIWTYDSTKELIKSK